MISFLSAIFSLLITISLAFPEQGVWIFNVNQDKNFVAVSKVVYRDTAVYINVNCNDPKEKSIKLNISYVVWMLPCYERGLTFESEDEMTEMKTFHRSPDQFRMRTMPITSSFLVYESPQYTKDCNGHSTISLDSVTVKFKKYPVASLPMENDSATNSKGGSTVNLVTPKEKTLVGTTKIEENKAKERRKRSDETNTASKDKAEVNIEETKKLQNESKENKIKDEKKEIAPVNMAIHSAGEQPQFVLGSDGVYIVSVMLNAAETEKFSGTINIKIRGADGYLSALDWPMLPFYGTMCGIYVIYAIAWLVVSACQWRDLLRIQFWIGGVIFLGMLEKAVYYAEYQSINFTGKSVLGAVITAEIVSCFKRTLARMLVIIVSLGFGIVKPRLGPLLQGVVVVGGLYFVVSLVEAFIRVHGIRNDPYRQFLLATILLAVLDSFICWWIFSSLVQTTRTLRLRRNIVKLSLYRHFTNTLIFAVIASVAFMVWSLKTHRSGECIEDWKELWVDEAYWRLLFSIMLLVIMILWRPTNNNQRFAFTPLLDAADDEDDEPVVPDSFDGMKMRGAKNQNHNSTKGVEEDLKWIDENIPSAISDIALPSLLDSDEEIMTTKFEMSKMN